MATIPSYERRCPVVNGLRATPRPGPNLILHSDVLPDRLSILARHFIKYMWKLIYPLTPAKS